MIVTRILIAALACALALSIARADTPDEQMCHKIGDLDGPSLDKIIVACTRAIRQVAHDDQDLIYLRRSKAYSLKGDFARAFADVEQSIKLYGISKYIGIEGRADIRFRQKDLDGAIADYTLAISLDEANGTATVKRNMAFALQGKFDRVVASSSEYLAHPNWAYAGKVLIQRGISYSYTGAPQKALVDFKILIERNAKDYTALDALLWHEIVARRFRLPALPSELKDAVYRASADHLATRLLTGKADRTAVAAAANQKDSGKGPDHRRWYSCDAHYFGGLWAIAQAQREDALLWLQRAAVDCNPDIDGDQRNWRVWSVAKEIQSLMEAPNQDPVSENTVTKVEKETPQSPATNPITPSKPETGVQQGATVQPPDEVVRAHYELTERIGNPAAWQAFLAKYPDGFYSDLARAQLAKMGVEPSHSNRNTDAPTPDNAAGGPLPARSGDKALKALDTFRDCASCPEMIVAPPGTFVMGSPHDEPDRNHDESPQHAVRFAQAFAAGRYLVTFDEWDACVSGGGCNGYVPTTPWGRGKMPVMRISWYDAKAYVDWLARQTGQPYRLLSEAEREYIARAGTKSAYWWGTSAAGREDYYKTEKPVVVTALPPNPWGFFQVHGGSLHEWVEDCGNPHYSGAPADGSAWNEGLCDYRVLRGSSWGASPGSVRSANRRQDKPAERHVSRGFRVGRSLGRPADATGEIAAPVNR